MAELLELGSRLVDGYVAIREIYDLIMEKQQDFIEAVRIFAQFN